jgi:autotransporter-associated beta strand protein
MRKPSLSCLPLLLFGASVLAAVRESAAGPNVGINSKFYEGGSIFGNNWSDPFNWRNLDAPVNGNVVVSINEGFFGLNAERVINYDQPDSQCYVIVNLTGQHRITGGRIAAFTMITKASNTQSFRTVFEAGGITATSFPGTEFSVGSGAELEMRGLEVRGDTILLYGGIPSDPNLAGLGPSRILINREIRSTDDWTIFVRAAKTGGSVELTSANTFTGEVRVESGALLRATHKDALGSALSETVVTGGTVEFALGQAVTVPEPMRLNPGILRLVPSGAAQPTVTFSGDMEFRNAFQTAGSAINLSLPAAFTGVLDGDATFNTGGRPLRLAGSKANSDLRITTDADLTLAKPPGVPAVTSLTLESGATVRWAADFQLDDSPVNGQITSTFSSLILNNATAELGSHRDAVDSLTLSSGSTVRIDAGGALQIASLKCENRNVESRLEGSGVIEVSGKNNYRLSSRCVIANRILPTGTNPQLIARGSATSSDRLILEGVCTAPLVLEDGTVEVNSASPAATVLFAENERPGTLLGIGTVGTISAEPLANGILSPGRFDEPGILRCGNATLVPNITLRADLRGTTPGSGHDQLAVTGTVNLANASLVVDFSGFNPVAGTSFTIISNDGSDPIVGTFAGMPQGATVLGGRFAISYTGGSGNDIVLTAIAPPSGVTRTWTGNGTNDFWSTTQNWNPVGAPQNGDALVFPSNTARRTNINDRSNLAVQSITISGGPFTLAGNTIALAGGITVTGTVLLSHSIQVPINLTAAQTFSIGPQFLAITRDINTNGMALTFRTEGTPGISAMTCNGILSGGVGDQFIKSGNGLLNLTGASTTRGNFHHTRGVVRITNAAALGSRVGSTTVDAGAELIIAGTDLAFNEPVALTGKLTVADNAGTVAISDPLDCAATAELFVSATGVTQVNLFDELNGIALRKTGPGIMNITGAKTKVLSEGITIDEGRLIVTGTAGVIALPGNTTVRGILEIKQRNVTEADSQFFVEEGGSVLCDSPEIAIAGLTMTGGTLTTDGNGIALNGPLTILPSPTTSLLGGNLTLPPGVNDWNIADGPAAEDLRVTAILKETVLTDANLRLTGPGTSVFTANNSIDQFTVDSGNATFQGTSTNTDLKVNGGAVKAAGRFLNVLVADGAFGPGTGLGQGTVAEIDGSGGRVDFEINGASSDRIIVTGPGDACNLGAIQLALLPSAAPALGTVLTLVDVQGGGVVQSFRDHPEGSTLFAGAQRYRINYTGGNGNDVTLTALPPVPRPELRFTNLSVTENLSKGIRSLHVSVSGGEGAIGLGIPFETSSDLARWDPLPFLLFGDASGNIQFEFKAPLGDEGLFVRGRLP